MNRRTLGGMDRIPRFSFFVIAAIGIAFRTYQISAQIIADDEWHALRVASEKNVAYIVTHFGNADYSIPLALFFKSIHDTVGLSEMAMRLPMLCCGVVLLLLLPALVRLRFNRGIGTIYAALIALSPLLIYFSRYARPYGIGLLLSLCAVISFYRWWTHGNVVCLMGYMASAAVASWFLLIFMPFVITPLLCGGAISLYHRTLYHRARMRQLLIAVLGIIALMSCMIVPALIVDFNALRQKASMGTLDWSSIVGLGQLLYGTKHNAIVLILLCVSILGAIALYRRQRHFFYYISLLFAGQILALLVARPAWLQAPIVLARYCLPLLPVVVLLLSVGIYEIELTLVQTSNIYKKGIFSLVVCLTLLFGGPLAGMYYYPNAWTNHALFQYDYDQENAPFSYSIRVRPKQIPKFYRSLGALPPGSIRILEVPWYYSWSSNPYAYYQRVHRQNMAIGFTGEIVGYLRDGELRLADTAHFKFKHFISVSDYDAVIAGNIDYIVVHRSLRDEMPEDLISGPEHYRVPLQTEECLAYCRETYGAPVFEDQSIVVFQVKKRPGPLR